MGFRLGIGARRDALLGEVVKTIGADRCFARVMDMVTTEQALMSFSELISELGDVDEVYLVAGTGYPNPDLSWKLEENTLAVNCLGFAALAVASINYFERRKRGHLVVITSVAAIRPWSEAPAYGASKTFESVYARALRMRVRKLRLPVYISEIRPGFVDTAMMKADKSFWVVSPQIAAAQIIAAVRRRARIAYVPHRWGWVAWIVRLLPDWIG